MSKDATATAKFKAIARIASGGMADIYLTEVSGPSGFRKLAVIKRLRPADAEDEEMVSMFMDEARLAARLNHPNIVNTFEVGEDDAGHFIAMEYLEGQPLDRVLRRTKAATDFSLAMQLYVLAQVLGALQYAHDLRDYDQTALGIVHRDVSPHNVFILYSGQSKLVDFGIAKSANAIGRTRAGAIKGKFAYMAPEQARTDAVDARSDVFAVGLILWEALTKQRLWPRMNESQILNALLSGTPIKRPSELVPDVPETLERICMKAIALAPEDRYASAAEMQIAIEDAMRDLEMRVTSREVGAVLERTFGSDRARLRDEVESFLRRPIAPEALPVLALEPSAAGDPRQTSASFSNSNGGLTSAPRASTGTLVRAGLVGLALAVVGGVIVVRQRPPAAAAPPPEPVVTASPTTAEPTTPAPSASASADAPPARVVRLELSAAPDTAEVFLDDVPVPNPFRTRRTADGSVHVVRVANRGYAPQSRTVTLAEDVLVDVALSPLPQYVQLPAPARPKATPAPAASARPLGAASPAPDSPPRAPALDDPLTPPPPKKAQPTLDQTPW